MPYTNQPRTLRWFVDDNNNQLFQLSNNNIYYIQNNTTKKIEVAENCSSNDFRTLKNAINSANSDITDYLNKNRDKIKNCCLTRDI